MEKVYKQYAMLKMLAMLVLLSMVQTASAQSQTSLKASFTQDTTKGCLPLVVKFENTSKGSIVAYHWDFGNGNTSALENPGAIYTKQGSYTVKLIVTEANGNKDTMVKPMLISALPNPKAGFSLSAKGGCEGDKFTFTDTSIIEAGSLKKWQWSFGDGATDSLQNPKHSYTNEGEYGISLIVYDENGCKSYVNYTKLIKVTKPANVSFTADNTGACVLPLTVNFTDNSSKTSSLNYTYEWDFGNGIKSTQEEPTFVYNKMGQYDVQLTLTDDNNCAQTLKVENYISIGKTKAAFKVANSQGCLPFTPQFENTSIGVPSDATIVWYFGNGDSAVGETPSYSYTQAGTYDVTLAITSPSGCNDIVVQKAAITVLPTPVATFAHGNPISCFSPHTINFSPVNNNTTAWHWDFGDGDSSTEKRPAKTYTVPGVYTVTLTITDNNGCVASSYKKNLVKVNTQIAKFTPSVNHGCVPLKVDFKDQSQTFFGIANYQWDFGNGTTSTTQHNSIIYTKAGTYYPKLIIKDNNGCADTMVFDSIPVGNKTNPGFYTNQTKGCTKDMRRVEFYNTTKNIQGIDSFYWDFTNITSRDVHPVIDYVTHPGVYDVKLVSYSNGCADTAIKKDYITILMPEADAAIIEDPCVLDTVHFINYSTGGHIYNWALNNDTIKNTQEFKRFLNPGNHHLALFVKDTTTGCWDTKEYSIVIRKPLKPGFVINVDSICANTNFVIQDTTHGSVTSNWDFGNGSSAEGKIQSPFYYNPGKYDVTLEVSDIYGCKKSITKPSAIKILGPDFMPIVTPNKGCFPLDAQLIKTGSSAHGIDKVVWSLGSQQVKTFADTIPFVFNTETANMHTDGQRMYLTVTDKLGCTVSRNATVKLSKPVAEIAHKENLLCAETEVNFWHDNNKTKQIGTLEYVWTLDGKDTYNAENNIATYSQNGTHNFKLVVKEKGLGCIDSVVVEIPVVTKKLKAGFTIDETKTTCPPLVSTFADASVIENTTIAGVEWDFGDGAASQLQQPVKNYFYPGEYDITYTITDAEGCENKVVLKSHIQVGGPTGEYTIDKNNGCIPFDVNFTSISRNAKTISWDFGNGLLGNGSKATNQYSVAGTYTPSMLLEDSMGCKVIYPVEPITGFQSPKPHFTYTGKCLYDTFSFNAATNKGLTTLKEEQEESQSFVWIFNGEEETGEEAISKVFNSVGEQTVELKVIADNGCTSTATEKIDIQPLKASFTATENEVCRFSYINLVDNSTVDAGMETRQWLLGEGRVDTTESPLYNYTKPGEYGVTLIIKDKNGCYDTAKASNAIEVFDTLTPPTPLAHRVTVKENNTIHLEFSPYLSRDFNNYVIFRSTKGAGFEQYKIIGNPTDTVFIDEAVNTYKQSYTYKVYSQTKCDKLSVDGESEQHTTVLLQTVGDTNKVVLNWSHYQGWGNLGSYNIYRKSSGESEMLKIATVDAATANYTDNDVICGYTYTYAIYAQQNTTMPLVSRSNNSSAAPIHKATVKPGYLVRATVENDDHVLVEFAKPDNIKAPIASYSIEKSTDGINYTQVFKTKECCVPFEDFKTDVHNKSYYYRVIATDVCGDVSVPSNMGKTMVLKAKADNEDNVQVKWSGYKQWDEGIASYEIEQMNSGGFFEKVGTNPKIDTTFVDMSNLFNQLPKVCYRVKATSNTGTVSYSNTDCASGRSTLFVPNAFTPNGDANNNKFVVVGAYIKEYEINIYNRYGEKLYTSYSLDDSWDGMYKGQTAQEGAYLYVINAKGIDYKTHNYSGTVTLLR